MVLVVKNLRKNYFSPNGEIQPVVDIPSFSLESAKQIALQGESGSGKTTFLNLIAGILQADDGEITIDGTEMTSLSEAGRDSLRAKKSATFFRPLIFCKVLRHWKMFCSECLSGSGQTAIMLRGYWKEWV